MSRQKDFADLKAEALARIRALRGDLDKKGRGTFSGHESFKAIVDFSKNPNRACALQKHFAHGTCAYELAGYLESEAERIARPDRFMFHDMKTLMSGCFKGERTEGNKFSRREFWYAVTLLRAVAMLSPRLTREGREGVIVAPHASLCVREDKQCRFVGFTVFNRAKRGLVGRFTVVPEGVIWRPDSEETQWDS